jgi:hypothetical protein
MFISRARSLPNEDGIALGVRYIERILLRVHDVVIIGTSD